MEGDFLRRRSLTRRDLAQRDVYYLPVERLLELSDKAVRSQLSAAGRPAWTREHADVVEGCYLRVFGPDPTGAVRCIVTLLMSTPPARYFTLDVMPADVHSLRRLSRRQERALLSELIELASHVPVTPKTV
jgi:hypothetical protein